MISGGGIDDFALELLTGGGPNEVRNRRIVDLKKKKIYSWTFNAQMGIFKEKVKHHDPAFFIS